MYNGINTIGLIIFKRKYEKKFNENPDGDL